MSEFKPNNCFKEAVCIEAMRVFDSCSSQDCLEDLELTFCDPCMQELINSASYIKCKCVEVVNTTFGIDPVPFNKGFYTVDLTYTFKVDLVLLINKRNPLASAPVITVDMLDNYVEILHGDNTVPNISSAFQKRNTQIHSSKKHIFVYERGSQFDILSSVDDAFMWVSPLPKAILDRFGLVQRKCSDVKKTNRDLLIYQNNYRISHVDQLFLQELQNVKHSIINML